MTTMRELRRWYIGNAAGALATAVPGFILAAFAPFDAGQRAGFCLLFALLLAVHLACLTWEFGTKRKAIRAGLRRVKAEAIRREGEYRWTQETLDVAARFVALSNAMRASGATAADMADNLARVKAQHGATAAELLAHWTRENSSPEVLTHEPAGCSIHTDPEKGGEE